MLQRFYNVPATPSWRGTEGGLVLDRVISSFGGASFWANVTARLRAQAAWDSQHTREGKPHRALAEPSVYGLTLRARCALPRDSLLRGSAQLDSLVRWLPSPDAAAGATAAEEPRAPPRVRLSLLSTGLLKGHSVAADALWHAQAAQPGSLGYAELPRAAALSVASRRKGPLRYRLGVATAPPSQGGADVAPPEGNLLAGFSPLYAQAGAELGGAASFYSRGSRSAERGSADGRAGHLLLPQRTRLTLSATVGALGRAPLRPRPAAAVAPEPAASTGRGAPLSALRVRLASLASGCGAEGLAFGSLGAALSLGSFKKPVLDFTQLQLRLDAQQGSGALKRMLRADEAARAGSSPVASLLEGATLSLSLCQQVVGPVRVRADARLPVHAAAALLRSTGSAGGAEAPGAKPELVYSLDVALPPLLGGARVVAWYCPHRQEALAELRLLDT